MSFLETAIKTKIAKKNTKITSQQLVVNQIEKIKIQLKLLETKWK